jgi:hypothetical protein
MARTATGAIGEERAMTTRDGILDGTVATRGTLGVMGIMGTIAIVGATKRATGTPGIIMQW